MGGTPGAPLARAGEMDVHGWYVPYTTTMHCDSANRDQFAGQCPDVYTIVIISTTSIDDRDAMQPGDTCVAYNHIYNVTGIVPERREETGTYLKPAILHGLHATCKVCLCHAHRTCAQTGLRPRSGE